MVVTQERPSGGANGAAVLEALAVPGVMVSLQINEDNSNGARFYAVLFHLVIFCFFRHVPGLPAQVRLKRPIPGTKGN